MTIIPPQARVSGDRLARLLSERRFCYYVPEDAYIEGYGYRASIVIENESGHFPTGTWPYTGAPGETMPYFWGPTLKIARSACYAVNQRLGLSAEDVGEIIHSSFAARE